MIRLEIGTEVRDNRIRVFRKLDHEILATALSIAVQDLDPGARKHPPLFNECWIVVVRDDNLVGHTILLRVGPPESNQIRSRTGSRSVHSDVTI